MSDFLNDSDESLSSCHTFYSDKIHSDVEAELYSLVHHGSILDNAYEFLSDSVIPQNNESVAPGRIKICNSILQAENQHDIVNNRLAQVSQNEDHYTEDKIENNTLYNSFESSCNDSLPCKNTSNRKDKDLPSLNISPINFVKDNLIAFHKQQMDSVNSVDKYQNCTNNLKIFMSGNCSPKVCEVTSKKDNRKCKNTLFKTTKKKRKSIALENSDSDSSVILIDEDDENLQCNLKTNLSNEQDTISLSSDCSEDFSCSVSKNKWSEKMKHAFTNNILKKNMSMPNIKLGENTKDLWYVNDEDLYRDLYRSKKFSGRYHEHYQASCSTCKQKGHTARNCMIPKTLRCYLCGGRHISAKCRSRICPKCFSVHFRRCSKIGVSFCPLCNMNGHQEKDCPDLWRRYHLTTNTSKIVKAKKVKQDTPIYCFNCGFKGHFGSNCTEPRMKNNCFPTWTSVISYDNPNEHYKNTRESRSMISPPRNFQYMQNENQYSEPQERMEKRRKRRRRRKKYALPSEPPENMPSVREPYFPRTPRKNVVTSHDSEHLLNVTTLQEIKQQWKQKRSRRRYLKHYRVHKYEGDNR